MGRRYTAIKGYTMPRNFFHLTFPVRQLVRTRQRMQGGKLKAARMVVSSPNLKNALHKQSHPTESSSTARTSRAASNVPSRCLGEKLKGGGDGEEEDVGCAADIKVHNRVADEVLGLSPGEKKSWWVPHPETGVFTPHPESKALSLCGPRLPYATVDEDKKVWIRAEEDLEDAYP